MSTRKTFECYTHLLIFILINTDMSASICTRSPSIIGYSRPHGALVSSYKFTWKSATCNNGSILQYQLQLAESCSTALPVTILTGSNKTSTTVVISSCIAMDCFIRIRAELSDGSFTDYSTCVLVNNQLMRNQQHIKHYHQDICVPIHGPCSTGLAPDFYINGHWTPWSAADSGDQLYNVTYSQTQYNFCFRNITENIIITEYCLQNHVDGCSLCSVQDGELYFQSHSEIFISVPTVPIATSHGIGATVTVALTSRETSDYTAVTTYIGGPITTPTNITNYDQRSVTIIVGAVLIGMVCVLIGLTLVVLSIIACYRRKSTDATCLLIQKSKSGNIYEEPSLPNPLYQELDVRPNSIEMITNDAYSHVVLWRDSNGAHNA